MTTYNAVTYDLRNAVLDNDASLVEDLLDPMQFPKPVVTFVDADGNNLMALAVLAGSVEAARVLLERAPALMTAAVRQMAHEKGLLEAIEAEADWDDSASWTSSSASAAAPVNLSGLSVQIPSRSESGDEDQDDLGSEFDDELPPFTPRSVETRLSHSSSARTPGMLSEGRISRMSEAELSETNHDESEMPVEYELLEPIGVGATARIIKARDVHRNKYVAVKQFKSEEEFLEELQVAEALGCTSPYFTCYIGTFEDEGMHHIVYDIATSDLVHWMQQNFDTGSEDAYRPVADAPVWRMPVELVLDFLHAMVSSVDWMVRKHIVHRDIKPANVLVYQSGEHVMFSMGDLASLCAINNKCPLSLPRCPDDLYFRSSPNEVPPAVFDYMLRGARAGHYEHPSDQQWVDYYGLAICIFYFMRGFRPWSMEQNHRLLELDADIGPLDHVLLNTAIDLMMNGTYQDCQNGFKMLRDAVFDIIPRSTQYGMHRGIKYHGETFSGYNSPKATPSHPTKSHVVLAKEGNLIKLIRFGQQGVKGAGKHPKTAAEKRRRRSFKRRHAKNIAKGKMSAAYWADKVKW